MATKIEKKLHVTNFATLILNKIFRNMSDAIANDRVSKIVGYKLTKGDFAPSTPNLPQRIVILGEANEANQASFPVGKQVVTSAQQAGQLYGYGSPIHAVMRILRPSTGGGVGSIPTIVIAQEKASGATSKQVSITASGVATSTAQHTVVIGGRRGLDGANYNFVVETGDDAAAIASKIEDAVNGVLSSPMTATSDPYEAVLESKWRGLTANSLTVSVDTNGNDAGISYAFNVEQAGAGSPSVGSALALFGNEWNTIVVNTYGTNTDILTELEQFNGIADAVNPTGRYRGDIFKPLLAFTGSVAEDPSSVTSPRKNQMTVAICPAPLSAGQQYEAAANMVALAASIMASSPHLDVSGQRYPDMPTPESIGAMSNSDNRDTIVKKGCSTVDLRAGQYEVVDFVTTYHPDGETPPQYRYPRNLNIDWNVRYTYFLRELSFVVDHVIAADSDVVNATRVVKPSQWKAVISQMAADFANRALIADVDFMRESITVNISSTNPDRLETFFRYKRTGYARISATTAEAGFNFGSTI